MKWGKNKFENSKTKKKKNIKRCVEILIFFKVKNVYIWSHVGLYIYVYRYVHTYICIYGKYFLNFTQKDAQISVDKLLLSVF